MVNLLRMNVMRGLLLICFIWALINIGNLFVRAVGFTDFFAYWYAGQYLRQNVDPYTEFSKDERTRHVEIDGIYVQGVSLLFPIQYFDGIEDTQASLYEYSSTKTTPPTITAPLNLILTGFSFISWSLASKIWLFMNFILIFGVAWLTFHYVEQSGVSLSIPVKLLLFLILLGLDATRSSLQQGQSTILIVFLGFLTLYLIDKNHILWAGIVLGVALSKYNIILPGIFLLLLYKQHFKVLFVAILTQITGILIVSLLSGEQIYDIIRAYVNVAVFVNRQSNNLDFGVNLGSYFESGIWNTSIFTVLFSLVVLGYLIHLLSPHKQKIKTTLSVEQARLIDIHILSILTLFSLLAVYHLKYDIFSIFICLCLFALVSVKGSVWNLALSVKRQFVTIIGIALFPLFVSFVFSLLITNTVLARLAFASQTLSLVIFLMICFWLLRLLLSRQRTEQVEQGIHT